MNLISSQGISTCQLLDIFTNSKITYFILGQIIAELRKNSFIEAGKVYFRLKRLHIESGYVIFFLQSDRIRVRCGFVRII